MAELLRGYIDQLSALFSSSTQRNTFPEMTFTLPSTHQTDDLTVILNVPGLPGDLQLILPSHVGKALQAHM
jgi:hypothetical protein